MTKVAYTSTDPLTTADRARLITSTHGLGRPFPATPVTSVTPDLIDPIRALRDLIDRLEQHTYPGDQTVFKSPDLEKPVNPARLLAIVSALDYNLHKLTAILGLTTNLDHAFSKTLTSYIASYSPCPSIDPRAAYNPFDTKA